MQNSRTENISARFGPHAGRADVRPAFVKGLLEAACWSTLRWRRRRKPNLGNRRRKNIFHKIIQRSCSLAETSLFSNLLFRESHLLNQYHKTIGGM